MILNELRNTRDYFVDQKNWNERSGLGESRRELRLDKLCNKIWFKREIHSGNSYPYTPMESI